MRILAALLFSAALFGQTPLPSPAGGGGGSGGGNVTGTMTPSTVPVATAAHTLGDSNLTQNGDGTLTPQATMAAATPTNPTFNAAGTTTCNLATSASCAPGTMTGNSTLVVGNPHGGTNYAFIFTQDGTGGRTWTYPAAFQGVCQPSVTASVTTTVIVAYNALTGNYTPISCTSNDTPPPSGSVQFISSGRQTGTSNATLDASGNLVVNACTGCIATTTRTPSIFGGATMAPDANALFQPLIGIASISGSTFFNQNVMTVAASTTGCVYGSFTVPGDYTASATAFLIDFASTDTNNAHVLEGSIDYTVFSGTTSIQATTSASGQLTGTQAISGTAGRISTLSISATAADFSVNSYVQYKACQVVTSTTLSAAVIIPNIRFSYVGYR